MVNQSQQLSDICEIANQWRGRSDGRHHVTEHLILTSSTRESKMGNVLCRPLDTALIAEWLVTYLSIVLMLFSIRSQFICIHQHL